MFRVCIKRNKGVSHTLHTVLCTRPLFGMWFLGTPGVSQAEEVEPRRVREALIATTHDLGRCVLDCCVRHGK